MRKTGATIILGIIGIFVFLIQIMFAKELTFFGITSNIFTIYLVFLALYTTRNISVFVGLAVSLIMDFSISQIVRKYKYKCIYSTYNY